MDTARIRREFVGAIRLLGTDELRLFGGALAVAVGYAVWLGATGAALNFGLGLGEQPLSASAWQATSTGTLAAVVVLWVVLPAAVVTYLVDRAVTNESGNISEHYRFKNHPFLLVVPVLILYGAGVGAAVAVGQYTAAILGVLSAVGLFALVRTVAASYRVFSFSHPRLVELFLFVALAVDAIAIPISAATLTDRQGIVEAAATGLGNKYGTTAIETAVTGSRTVTDLTIPYLLAATALTPVALTLVYFVLQSIVGLARRVQSPNMRRDRLRTGQRLPEFAKPNHGGENRETVPKTSVPSSSTEQSSATSGTQSSGGSTTTNTSTTSTNGNTTAANSSATNTTTADSQADTSSADSQADTSDDDTDEDAEVSHTRVFKPPSDDDFEMDASTGTAGEDTAVVSEDGYVCPSCDDRFSADASFDYCPTCGSELEET